MNELKKIHGAGIMNPQFTMDIASNFVVIKFRRPTVSCIALKTTIEQASQYGSRKQRCDKSFSLKVELDAESEVTSMRLNLLKKVSVNLLKFQNYDIQDREKCSDNYIYTIKSIGNVDHAYNRYLCGAVLNANKKKEKDLTQNVYLQNKLEKINELNAQRCSDVVTDKDNIVKDAQKIAKASVSYELLSTKHTSPVILENSDDLDRFIKGNYEVNNRQDNVIDNSK